MNMKKITALLLALCLLLGASIALAEESYNDYPFVRGVDYSERYRDYGAQPSMLNFGSVKMNQIQSITSNSVKKTTIKSGSASKIEQSLIDGDLFYYIYAKYQTSKSVPNHTINTMLVMEDPTGNYYTMYDEMHVEATGSNYRYSGLARFFDATTPLIRCYLDHGELPTGEYVFTMYFNDKFFRSNTVVLK